LKIELDYSLIHDLQASRQSTYQQHPNPNGPQVVSDVGAVGL
jgi:hypothetical protein